MVGREAGIERTMYQHLSERFRLFAETECQDSSPLYAALCQGIAQDEALLDIAARSAPGQPVPNLLLASVHYLLSHQTSHALAGYYPTFATTPCPPTDAFPAFRQFVSANREDVLSLLQTRLVQTNEVRRCAYLFPAISLAASAFERRPLALVEIGTSAGLNLLWDQYRYSYGGSQIFGNAASPVHVASSFRGRSPSILSAPLLPISHRIGLDLNVIDTSDIDQVAWLRALIWPEHHERRDLIDAALRVPRRAELDMRTGDGFSMLSGLAEEISEESLLCVYHTHVANQISNDERARFLRTIETLGAKRDVVHIFNNIKPHLHLTAYRSGRLIDLPLASTDGHARWIEWLAEDRTP